MAGGMAVAEVLFGDMNPCGKLAVSIPRSAGQLPVYYNHPPSAENKYKYSTWEPLYPFGYGLSYTEFEYSGLEVPGSVPYGRDVEISVEVKNSGQHPGDETVLLFVNDLVSSLTTPVRELKGFQRVSLEPGEGETVSFVLPFNELAFYNRKMEKAVEPGEFEVMIGDLKRTFEVLPK